MSTQGATASMMISVVRAEGGQNNHASVRNLKTRPTTPTARPAPPSTSARLPGNCPIGMAVCPIDQLSTRSRSSWNVTGNAVNLLFGAWRSSRRPPSHGR